MITRTAGAADTRSWTQNAGRVLRRPQFWFGLIVLLIGFGWYALFWYRPIALGLRMSFMKYNLVSPEKSEFVGLRNFQTVFGYSRFWTALRNTFSYSALSYVIGMPVALFVSWCLASVRRARPAYQWVVFLPVVVSMVAISMLFKMLMNPQIGALNRVLRSLGLPGSQWIHSSDTAMLSIVAVDVWKGLGFTVVLLSTAMMNIPQSLYDAAKVDGATGWRLFRTVTLPLIVPTFALVSVMSVMGGLQVYVSVSVLGPGPGTSTLVLNQLIISEAFAEWRYGFATATSLVIFVVILILSYIQLRVLRPRWEY
jgi:ABC-type sugar transport system permease subunit